jgi:putative DNA primase/helicase
MFSEYAQNYWAKGLPVMPLRPQSKVPCLPSWQHFCTEMPSEELREAWLRDYPDANMGLALGPQSGVIALDLDSLDPVVARVLDQLLPPSPWTRIGKKGSVRAYKFNGERTYRVKAEDGSTVFEVLSRGTQVVMPPSIHPDTLQPYRSDTNLYDVIDRLVPLPQSFEKMVREALIAEGVKLQSRGMVRPTDWVAAGGRDSAMVGMAGLQAKAVLRGQSTLLEALNEMVVWAGTYTERVVGDEIDVEKGRKKVIEFLRRDIQENKKHLPKGWDVGMSLAELEWARKELGNDVEAWSLEDTMTYIQEKMVEIPRDNVKGRLDLIEEVLQRISKSPDIDEMGQGTILNFLNTSSGRMVTIAALRKRLNDIKGNEIAGNDHTEIAKCLIDEIERYGKLAYYQGGFYQWQGAHWCRLPDGDVFKTLAEEFGSLPAARRHSDHKGIVQTLINLVPHEIRTDNTPGVNFANGYLTMDMQLLPHSEDYGATYVLPYRYAPETGAPLRLMSLLDQCWGEDEDYAQKVLAFKQVIASMLFGTGPRFARAVCFFGPPKTGKSTALDIIMGLVPEEVRSAVPPDEWGDKFMPTTMIGKLVNRCGELSESKMIAGDKFKSIVEGGEMSGQYKGQQIFTFKPACMHFFASNHLPKTRDTSGGFTRRWLFLEFTRTVSDDQKIAGLADDILSEEREAIVSWAAPEIQGLMANSEYVLPKSHQHLTFETANSNNGVRFFLTSGQVRISAGPDANNTPRIREGELYRQYYAFCRLTSNVQPVSLRRFRTDMAELQSELGFQFLIDQADSGEGWYTNITPAGSRKSSK